MCVCARVNVCLSVCLFCSLDILVTSSLVSVFGRIIDFISFICRNMLCVTVTLIHICVSVGGGGGRSVYILHS